MNSVRLRGMTWDHPRGVAGLEAATIEYARTTGTTVAWDRRSLQAFADAPIRDLAERYDLIVLDHPHVGRIAETECLLALPAPDDAAEASLGGSLESYVWNGALWAYPVDAACQAAVRRPDLCERGLPDWESVAEGGHGLSLATPLLPIDALCATMTLVASRGETVLPFSDKEFFSRDNGLAALGTIKALYRAGPSEAVAWNPIAVLEALSTTDDFAFSPCLFGYINYARPGFRDRLVEYCDLPVYRGRAAGRGILGGAGIGVSAATEHPESAIAFARWATSEPVQSGVYLESEGQPAHRGSWRSMGADPRFAGFLGGALSTMENAWTRPRDPWFLDFADDVCEIFPDFLLADRDEEAFLGDINGIYRKRTGARA